MYADVVLPLAVPGAYTYRLSPAFEERVVVGSRVVVPLGKSKRYTAIVIRLHTQAGDLKEASIREVEELVDECPLLLPPQIELWRWMAQYYMCYPGEIMKAALPAGLKLESETVFSTAEDGEIGTDHCSDAELKVIRTLATHPLPLSELRKKITIPKLVSTLKALIDRQLICVEERISQSFRHKTEICLSLAPAYASPLMIKKLLEQLRRSPAQTKALLSFLDKAGISEIEDSDHFGQLSDVRRTELLEALPKGGATTILSLIRRGALVSTNVEVARLKYHKANPELRDIPLSKAQQQAHDEILKQWEHKNVVLLHGITSSGKTEVYIQLIRQFLKRGQQVLFLLPEIALTTQITERLGKVFGEQLGVYHSKFPDNERVEIWQRQLGERSFPLLLGVRSSVFLPFQNLGLVIVDEEHESSYKQQDPAPRYNARDVAILMAHQAGAKVLLGTATPSLESYTHASEGKYGLVRLTQRFGNVETPRIYVEDLTELKRKKELTTPFSPRLQNEVNQAISQQQQGILFLNRRGYSPILQCNSCGWVPRCKQCDVPLSLHLKLHQLICHYCGTQYNIPTHCPQCNQVDLRDVGAGTEKIEAAVSNSFPQARVARMDLDTTRARSAYERIIRQFQAGHFNLLVGTQMVTKGLDFGGVSVVGIVNADQLLNRCDFRAHERAFQMLTQVAGRAGRRNQRGTVILQTRQPKLPVVQQIVAGDYEGMYHQEMEDRRTFHFPPEVRLIAIFLKHRDERIVATAARMLAEILRPGFGNNLLGPDKPVVGFVQRQHIRKLLVKVPMEFSLQSVRTSLLNARNSILSQKAFQTTRIYFDVDPL